MRLLLSTFALFTIAPITAAQSFNIDVGSNLGALYPLPADAYGAAAVQPGRWCDVHTPYSATLTNLDGSPSTVTTSSTTAAAFNQFPATFSGDDQNLMDDVQDLPAIGGPYSWTFSGLQGGNYTVYTYAFDPANNGRQTQVTVPGSSDPAQIVGGSWTGSPHVLGVTYALHHVTILGGTLTVQVIGQGTHDGNVNGFQLVFGGNPSGTSFCPGDGTGTACPCGNSGAIGNGCASSVNAQGANLVGQGAPSISNDTVVLTGSGMPNSSVLYFQGTSQQNGGAGSIFGDGLRCAAGSITRLGTKTNVNGSSSYPVAGDLSVSVRGGDSAGNVRTYQVWYRNSATFCTSSTFNLSNGLQITWVP